MRNLPKSLALQPRELAAAAPATRRLLYLDCAPSREVTEPNPVIEGLRGENWSVTELRAPEVLTALRLTDNGRFDRLAAGLRFFRELARIIRRHEVVFVQAGSEASIVGLALPVIVLARFFGRKVLLRLTSADIELLLDRRERFVIPILRQANQVVVGSRYLQKSLTRSRLHAAALAGPVKLDGLSHRVRERLQPRILMTAPLRLENNPLCALQAFRLVKQKYPRAELVVAGDGPMRRSLEMTVTAQRIYGVEFVSADHAQLAGLHDECDVYLNSSSVDETPAALVHAFASGLPVVVTDADGLLPMVRDRVSALIAPVNDHVGLADRIIELIENPELTATLSRAGAGEAQKYSWSRVRQDWVNTLTGLSQR